MRAAVAALLAGLLLSGCGARAADLFEVQRSGSIKGAALTLVVNDAGSVQCDRGASRSLPDELLLEARALARDLLADANAGRVVKPRAGSVLQYTVRLPDGEVRFADTSAGVDKDFAKMQAFVRATAIDVCGRER